MIIISNWTWLQYGHCLNNRLPFAFNHWYFFNDFAEITWNICSSSMICLHHDSFDNGRKQRIISWPLFTLFSILNACNAESMRAWSESKSFGDWMICMANIAKIIFDQIAGSWLKFQHWRGWTLIGVDNWVGFEHDTTQQMKMFILCILYKIIFQLIMRWWYVAVSTIQTWSKDKLCLFDWHRYMIVKNAMPFNMIEDQNDFRNKWSKCNQCQRKPCKEVKNSKVHNQRQFVYNQHKNMQTTFYSVYNHQISGNDGWKLFTIFVFVAIVTSFGSIFLIFGNSFFAPFWL